MNTDKFALKLRAVGRVVANTDAPLHAINATLILGLYAGILWLPILNFSGHGDQSLSDVAWYLVVDGIDRGYWASVALIGFLGAIGTVGALFVALAVQMTGIVINDRRKTVGSGIAAVLCLIALPPLFRPLSTGMLGAAAYGLPVAILYVVAVMVWIRYGVRQWDRRRYPRVWSDTHRRRPRRDHGERSRRRRTDWRN